ncbi:hypothetical protein PAPHI01_1477 [Pancytospora philotis]|nr:hypothetical protein PAPHI01_1477 [Pancytospora philotis]
MQFFFVPLLLLNAVRTFLVSSEDTTAQQDEYPDSLIASVQRSALSPSSKRPGALSRAPGGGIQQAIDALSDAMEEFTWSALTFYLTLGTWYESELTDRVKMKYCLPVKGNPATAHPVNSCEETKQDMPGTDNPATADSKDSRSYEKAKQEFYEDLKKIVQASAELWTALEENGAYTFSTWHAWFAKYLQFTPKDTTNTNTAASDTASNSDTASTSDDSCAEELEHLKLAEKSFKTNINGIVGLIGGIGGAVPNTGGLIEKDELVTHLKSFHSRFQSWIALHEGLHGLSCNPERELESMVQRYDDKHIFKHLDLKDISPKLYSFLIADHVHTICENTFWHCDRIIHVAQKYGDFFDVCALKRASLQPVSSAAKRTGTSAIRGLGRNPRGGRRRAAQVSARRGRRIRCE